MSQHTETIEDIRDWALSRMAFFKERIQKSTNEFDIEAEMYALSRVAEEAFKKMHTLNSRQEPAKV